MKVQIGDLLQTRTVGFDAIVAQTIFDNQRSNDGQAVEQVRLIIDRDVRNASDVLLREHDKMELGGWEWMFDRQTTIGLLHHPQKSGRGALDSDRSDEAREVVRPIAGATAG